MDEHLANKVSLYGAFMKRLDHKPDCKVAERSIWTCQTTARYIAAIAMNYWARGVSFSAISTGNQVKAYFICTMARSMS
ncbi:hypothetical protein [Neoaquamicrobium sediminum]|uniref:hypothetical protein n=1 Tax=Neoaquamicrobium sediminum TaxID=1849104 RepID=UPI0040383CCE